VERLRDAGQRVAEEPAADDVGEEAPGRRRLQILMAEDNDANRTVARALLGAAGFEIDMAHNGRIAVDKVQTRAYDVILMDVQMPIMDGLEATKTLRKCPRGRSIPIIGLTAGAMAEDREKCLAAGMNDYLPKPVDWDQLLQLLDKMESERYRA
jgi:CheY-like chemotaxis protein